MTIQALTGIRPAKDQYAGRWAIIGGVFGIVAFACLIAFLVMRPSGADHGLSHLLLRSHDAGIVLQSLCLIPLILALDAKARRHSPESSRAVAAAGLTAVILLVTLIFLSFIKVVADVLYMIPQGALGLWLIVVCRQGASGLPSKLRWLGIVAGVGLILIGIFPIGYALYVDSAILRGPISDDDPTPPGTERADTIVHIALAIGTIVGCSTYPVWTTLTGRWLLAHTET